jgi:hypothetical protein
MRAECSRHEFWTIKQARVSHFSWLGLPLPSVVNSRSLLVTLRTPNQRTQMSASVHRYSSVATSLALSANCKPDFELTLLELLRPWSDTIDGIALWFECPMCGWHLREKSARIPCGRSMGIRAFLI